MAGGKKSKGNWNEVDDAKLAKLFKDKELDPTKLETADVKKANLFWPNKSYSTFSNLYRRKARKWNLEKTLSGKRQGRKSTPAAATPPSTVVEEEEDADEEHIPGADAEEDVELDLEEDEVEVVTEDEEVIGEEEVVEITQDPVEEVTKSISKMKFATKTIKAASESFNLSFSCPWMCYTSSDNGREVVTVEFLIPSVHRSACKLKIGPCGRVLYCGIVVPKAFYNSGRSLDANQHDDSFNVNTHKAAEFRKVCDLIDKLADDNDEVIGEPMVISLPLKVEDQFYKSQDIFDNAEDGWEVLMIDNGDSKLIEEMNEGLGDGEHAIPPDNFILEVNMVSVVKPKTKKVKGKMRKVKSRPVRTFDTMSTSGGGGGSLN